MIVKTDALKVKSGSRGLVHHLLEKTHDNERIRLVQGSGKIIDQYYQISRASACPDGCVHIKLSPAEHEIMDESDWQRCLDLLADEFKFNADYATVVEHTKKGRTHRHIVFPAFDLNSNKRLNLWRSKVRSMSVAKKMEMQLGHALVPLNGYSKKRVSERLKKTGYDHYARLVEAVPDSGVGYGHKEAGLAKRNGYDVAELRTLFTSLIEQSDGVSAFKSALNEHGFELIEKGKRSRAYFRAIDKPDVELNATKLLGLKTKQFNSYLETGNKNDLFKSYTRKRLSNSIDTSGNRPSGVLDKQANKEEPAITQTIPDATTPAEPPVSIIQSEPDYQSDEGNAGRRDANLRTAEHDHGNTGNSNSGSEPDSRTDRRDDTQRGRRGQSYSDHSGKPSDPDRDMSDASYGTERTETDDRRRPTGTAKAGQNVKTDGTCVDTAITEQQRDLNNRLSRLLKRVSGMSSLEHGKRTLYGLNSGWNGWVSIPYENALTCRNYELTEENMRELVQHWQKRVAYHRSPVSSASPVMKNGSARMKIEMRNGDVFYDDGQQLTSTGPVSQQTAREIVMAAKAKGWSFVEITGSQQYRDEIAIQCRLNGISCNHPLSPAAEIKYNRIERKIFDNNMKRLSDTVQLQT